MALRLDGKIISAEIRENLRKQVEKIRENDDSFRPGLAIVQVGDREDSNVYIRMKLRGAKEIGMNAQHIKLSRYQIWIADLRWFSIVKLLFIDFICFFTILPRFRRVDSFENLTVTWLPQFTLESPYLANDCYIIIKRHLGTRPHSKAQRTQFWRYSRRHHSPTAAGFFKRNRRGENHGRNQRKKRCGRIDNDDSGKIGARREGYFCPMYSKGLHGTDKQVESENDGKEGSCTGKKQDCGHSNVRKKWNFNQILRNNKKL